MLDLWVRADSYADMELQSYIASPVPSLVECKRLTALPISNGGFGIPQFHIIVPTTYPSTRAAPLYQLTKLGLLPLSEMPRSDQRAIVQAMYTRLTSDLREELSTAYRSTLDDHFNPFSYGESLLTVCSTRCSTKYLILSDTEVQLGWQIRGFNSRRAVRCSCNSSAAVPGHELVCVLAGPERTKRHERVEYCLYQAFLASGLNVEVEPRGQWSAAQGEEEDTSRSHRT